MLTKELADSILNRMQDVIPYNINIMDKNGVIISSGDKSRIGDVHEGALKVLKDKSTVILEKPSKGAKPGVNNPIFFRKDIVGVIGITGDPKIVENLGNVVCVTAELLINQNYILNKSATKQKILEELLYEWIYIKESYSDDFFKRSSSLGIDVNLERNATIVECDTEYTGKLYNIINNLLKEQEFIVKTSSNTFVVLLKNNSKFDKKIDMILEKAEEFNIKIGIGRSSNKIYNSMSEGVKSLKIGSKLYSDQRVYRYSDLEIILNIASFIRNNDILLNFKKNFESSPKNKELIDTFITFIENNGEINKTSKTLHIHRNTLNYRLEKIEEATGKRFDNYLDLFQLIAFFMIYKLE